MVGRPPTAEAHVASPSTMERSQAFVEEGDEAFDDGDYREAIAHYRAAYDALTSADRVSYVGSIAMRNAMNAYAALLEREDDIIVVRNQLNFLSEFLQEVEQHDAQDAVGVDVLDELRELQATLEDRIELSRAQEHSDRSSPPPVLLDPHGPSGVDVPPEDPTDSSPPQRDWVGVGLLLGGTALVGTGAALTISGLTIPDQARRYANETPGFEEEEEIGLIEGSTARTEYLADEDARAQRFLTGGIVIVAAGIVTVAAGGLELIIRRRRGRSPDIALLPALGRSSASLSLRTRF